MMKDLGFVDGKNFVELDDLSNLDQQIRALVEDKEQLVKIITQGQK